MRAVSVLGILVVVTGLGLFIFGYLIPYFHSEFSVGEEEPGVSENSMSSGWESSIPLYNSMGLPVYEDEISLFVINSEKPVGADYIPDTVKVNEVQVQEKIADAVRLPADKEDATGHIADYTVLRYVGSVHAEAMQQRSMCLEEYISYLNSQ